MAINDIYTYINVCIGFQICS